MKTWGKILNWIAGILLTVSILCWTPLTVPKWLGREVYSVHQAENTANIPQNSIVYTKQEVCAYYGSGDVLVFSKGDENYIGYVIQNSSPSETVYIAVNVNTPDEGEAVSYENVKGIVTAYVPYLGTINDFLSTQSGQVIHSLVLSGILLLEIAGIILTREGKKKAGRSS